MFKFISTLLIGVFIVFNLSASPDFIKSNSPSKELIYINDLSEKAILDIQFEKNRIENMALKVKKQNKDLIFVLCIVVVSAFLLLIILAFIVRKKILLYKNLYLESNHRIKNNLSAVDYFISKKKDESKSDIISTDLSDIQSKLHTFYKIHESLVINENNSGIVLKDYIGDLLNKTAQSFGKDKVLFQTDMKTSIYIDVNKTCVLGMILNEFVTNSMSHASFYGIPNIFVSLEEKGKCITLKLVEKNKSNQENTIHNRGTQKGLSLVKSLCKQIDAKLTTKNNQGMQMLITLDR